jgi:hypothetical protein
MLIASKNMFKINNLKDQLNCKFKMKVLGVINKILGMNIGRDLSVSKLQLSYRNYLEKVPEHFGMHDCMLVNTQFTLCFRLSSALS